MSCSCERTYDSPFIIRSEKFSKVVKKLREFFFKKNFIEVHTQNRLSILAAYKLPENVAIFEYAGKIWPLFQTSEMWLEYKI